MVLRKRMITSILTNEKSVPEAVIGGETVHTYTNNQTEYVIYLDKEITGPHEYREVYETLRRATSQDIVRFIINCEGGEIDTAFQICHYMERTPAKTVAEVHKACSAATFIVLKADEILLNKYSYMMIHSYSWGINAKVAAIESFANHFKTQSLHTMYDIYDGFLSRKEIESIYIGNEIYLNTIHLQKRIDKFVKNRKPRYVR